MIHLYNSLTRQKELFKPLEPGKIKFYVCGITVYDSCHLGHARAMVCFDVIVRFLRSQNYEVNFVRNITDIDDKIINRANELQIPIEELTAKYIHEMNEDTKALNILAPNSEPRATQHIDNIINLIKSLLEKDYAYVSDNADVCYSVEKFKNYGNLSKKDIEGLEAGSRVSIVKEKRSPLDFVLWKKSKANEPSWPSPWGEGRPGWHIECSAMSIAELGEQFDIHGGGLDLQFPHHENEIAQSEAATGKTFANYWLHVGLLQINNEKMAKSLGNFHTIKSVLENYHPEVLRYFLLSSHYRSSLNYSSENLEDAERALTRLYLALESSPRTESKEIDEVWIEKFTKAMSDDFNTPIALSILFDLSHELNKTKNSSKLANTLRSLGSTLGILELEPEEFLQSGPDQQKRELIEKLISERMIAKSSKDWEKADNLRKELISMGVELKDSTEKTKWFSVSRRKKT